MNRLCDRIGASGVLIAFVSLGLVSTGCKNQPEASASAARAPVAVDVSIGDSGDLSAVAVTEEKMPPRQGPRFRSATPKREHVHLTIDEIDRRHASIGMAETFKERLELRRALMHHFVADGATDAAHAELADLLADVAANQGVQAAHKVGFVEAGNFFSQKRYDMAKFAYRMMLSGYAVGPYADEARLSLGSCHLEQGDYAEAASVWQALIDTKPEAEIHAWAHRKRALAQLLMGEFDASLDTLAMLEKAAPESHWFEYAKMRRGYVLAAANRVDEARSTYAAFLAAHPTSRYVALVNQQVAELETHTQVAQR